MDETLFEEIDEVESPNVNLGDSEQNSEVELPDQEVINDNTEVLLMLQQIDDSVNTLTSAFNEAYPTVTYSYSEVAHGGNGIDGYFVSIYGEKVYIPVDKIQYLSVDQDGEIINLSSQTISCYSLNDSGDRGTSYQLPSFGHMQRWTYHSNEWNSWSSWDDITALAENSNIIYGQTGVRSFDTVLLIFIVVFVAVIALFKGKSK